MKVNYLFAGTVILLITLGILVKNCIPSNHPVLAKFVNQNSIDVIAHDSIDLENIKISLTILGNEQTNLDIFAGGNLNAIPKEYGENDWTLSYNEVYFARFRHFKTSNWHEHQYSFSFFNELGKVTCEVIIDGPDFLKTTVQLSKVVQ